MSTFREVDNEIMAGVNSRFAEVIENDILRMQDTTNPKDTKKIYEIRNGSFQAPLMLLSLIISNNCFSTAPFQSPIQVNSTSIGQNVPIRENLNVDISIKNDCDFQHLNIYSTSRT